MELRENIHDWKLSKQEKPGKYTPKPHNPDYNNKKPSELKEKIKSENTEDHHYSFFTKDVQNLIFIFKTEASVKIQRKFRQFLLMKRNKLFRKVLLKVASKFSQFFVKEAKVIFWKARCSALKIQRTWKNKKNRTPNVKCSLMRKLLAQTVSVGSKLKRINSIINSVCTNRTMCTPMSDSVSTPEVKKSSLLYSKRSELKLHKRNSSLPDALKDILSDDYNNLTNDIPDIQQSAFATIPEIKTCEKESRSLIMKKESFKVKARKVKRMKLEELSQVLSVDEFLFKNLMAENLTEISKIPVVDKSSRFLKEIDLVNAKARLYDDYMKLIKY